jgi:hypothetical protein
MTSQYRKYNKKPECVQTEFARFQFLELLLFLLNLY